MLLSFPGLGAARKNSPAVILTLTQEWSRHTETDCLEMHKTSSQGRQSGKRGPRVYLLISRNALANLWGSEATSGVLPRVWLVGPSLWLRVEVGSSSSPQAAVTPGSNLSDPRAEDAREAEGSREKEQTLGIGGYSRDPVGPKQCFHCQHLTVSTPQSLAGPRSRSCSGLSRVHVSLQCAKLFCPRVTLRPLGGARQGSCAPRVQVRKPSLRGKRLVRGRAGTQPPPLLPVGAVLLPTTCFSFLQEAQGRSPKHLLHILAVPPSNPAPGSNNNLLHLYNWFTESLFPNGFQLYWL